jgi:tRNA wybutosine-synthesizing protein 3
MNNSMDQSNNNFAYFKKETLQKLHQSDTQGEIDEKVQAILRIINAHDAYMTTSSCAGRIVLIQLPEVGDKKNAEFLGRWHDPVQLPEIMNAVARYENGQLWFIFQSPIFHIATKTLKDADHLVKIGISSGFKHSGFKTEKPRIIVELCSTERMDVPLIKMNQQFVSSEYLTFLTEIGNDLMMRSQKKLRRLRQLLEKKIQ